MNKLQSKLSVTLNQWKEVYRNETAYSADLRNQDKVNEAGKMISKLENMIDQAANSTQVEVAKSNNISFVGVA